MTKQENPQTKNGDFPLSWKAQTPRFPHSHRTATAAVLASTPNQNHKHGLRYSLPSRLTHRFLGGSNKVKRSGFMDAKYNYIIDSMKWRIVLNLAGFSLWLVATVVLLRLT